MNLDSGTIVALTSLITVLLGGFVTLITARSTVKKQDVENLQKVIKDLQGLIKNLRDETDRQELKIKSQGQTIAEQDERIGKQDQKINTMREERDKSIRASDDLRLEVERLSDENAKLLKELGGVKEVQEERAKKISMLETAVDKLRKKVLELGGKLDTGSLKLEGE